MNQDYTSDIPLGAAFNVLVLEPGTKGVFDHTTSAANIDGDWTYIDHPLTNENPDALLYITKSARHYISYWHDHPTGVVYVISEGKWAIRNLDGESMVVSRTFNVLVPVNDTEAFVHRATAENTYGNATIIDHPLTNSHPDTIAFVTQNWNPGGGRATYNDSSVGVAHWSPDDRWDICNRPHTNTVPPGASFNVLVPNVDAGVFVHEATAANILGYQTFIDYPPLNNDPDEILFVTHSWNPGGVGGTYNDHVITVLYAAGRGEWGIMNQDFASMPPSATFNVMVPSPASNVFIHQATVENITSNWTYLDHSLTNNNPRALVFVTQHWNPGGGFGVFNDHPIGVWYSSGAGKWGIFNQDKAAMPEGAAFNVLVMPGEVYLPWSCAEPGVFGGVMIAPHHVRGACPCG